MEFKIGDKVYLKPQYCSYQRKEFVYESLSDIKNKQFTICENCGGNRYYLEGISGLIPDTMLSTEEAYSKISLKPKDFLNFVYDKHNSSFCNDECEFLPYIKPFLRKYFKNDIVNHSDVRNILTDSIYFFCTHPQMKLKVLGQYTVKLPSSNLISGCLDNKWGYGEILECYLKECTLDAWDAIRINSIDNKQLGYYLSNINTFILCDLTHHESGFDFIYKIIDYFEKSEQFNFLKLPESEIKSIEADTINVTIGADPEFEIVDKTNELVVSASSFEFLKNSSTGPIGLDGSGDQMELRPSSTPINDLDNFVDGMKNLFSEVNQNIGDKYEVTTKGDSFPLGGHFHIGIGDKYAFTNVPGDLIYLLDYFLGEFFVKGMNPSRTTRGYGKLSSFHIKPHGFEYRTPPSECFANPRIMKVCSKIVANVANGYLKGNTFNLSKTKYKATDYELKKYARLTDADIIYFKHFIDNHNKIVGDAVLAAWVKE